MQKALRKRQQDATEFLKLLYRDTVGNNDRNRLISIRVLSQELGFYEHPNNKDNLSSAQKDVLEKHGRYAQEIVLSLQDKYLTLVGHPNPYYEDGGEVQIKELGINKVENILMEKPNNIDSLNDQHTQGNDKSNRELRQKMGSYFDLNELQELAFDLNINWDDLAGETISLKIIEVIKHCRRNKMFDQLIIYLQQEKPIGWTPPNPTNKRLPPNPTMKIRIKFEYEAKGKTVQGKIIDDSGSFDLHNFVEGDYYDDGLAYAEAMASVVDHFYIFKIEKAGLIGLDLDKLSIQLRNLTVEYT